MFKKTDDLAREGVPYLYQIGGKKPEKYGSQDKANVQLLSIHRKMAVGLSHE